MSEEWSQWLDFDSPNVDSLPESPGVYVMHANMKTLFVGGDQNVREGLRARLTDECCGKAKRFRYMLTESPDSVRMDLLRSYSEKHAGKMPVCNSGKEA
jgi:hypothetical protein